MRLGVLGGTFDPVHLGHLVLAESARDQLGLDRVLFVPTGQPWRKEGRAIAPSGDRVAMLRLAIEGNESFAVSLIEVEQVGPSYTHVTLNEIAEANSGAEMYFILGRDALADLPNWKDPGRIMELATLVAAERVGEVIAAPVQGIARATWLQMPLIEISATAIRERVRQGRSIRYLVPPAVEAYIRVHGLYATSLA
jgi:nicotinate-nucleotide adenylyltransferase